MSNPPWLSTASTAPMPLLWYDPPLSIPILQLHIYALAAPNRLSAAIEPSLPSAIPNASPSHLLFVKLTTSQYTAAVKTSSLDATAKSLASLGNLVTKDAKLTTILEAPSLTRSDKSQIIAELEKAAGVPSSDKTVKNLLAALAENNRLSLLSGVCAKFGEIMSASRGEVEMIVTSATVRFSLSFKNLLELDCERRQRLAATL